MSTTLDQSSATLNPDGYSDSANGELPLKLPLELIVDDREVIRALVEYPEGDERNHYALEALKIGIRTLSGKLRAMGFFRTTFFLPVAASLVAVAVGLIAKVLEWPAAEPVKWVAFALIGLAPVLFLIGFLRSRLSRSGRNEDGLRDDSGRERAQSIAAARRREDRAPVAGAPFGQPR
jgi:hypothetical protein